MDDIELTKTERLLLSNQNLILAALFPEQADHYKHVAKVLQRGYTFFYGEVFQEIWDGTTPDDARYVVDVMEMYWRLQEDNDQLKGRPPDKLDPKELTFPGFDGNNESALMGFARYLKDDGRFNTLRVARPILTLTFPRGLATAKC